MPALNPKTVTSRRRWHLLALVAVAALVATACNVPSNDASDYNDAVRANFIDGCTGNIPETGGTTTSLAPVNFCQCAYEVFVASVPFNGDSRESSDFSGYPADAPTFVDFNSELGGSDEPQSVWAKLPEPVRQQVDRCPVGGPGPLAPEQP